MAISLVSTKFGSGLQVDRQASTNTRNVYVPQAPVKTRGEGHYPIYQSQPLFWKLGKSNWSWGKMGRGLLLGKNSPFSSIPIIGSFCKQPLSNFDLFDWAKKKKLGIKYFRDIFSRDTSPKKIGKECGIVNLDDIQGSGTHTGFVIENLENDLVEYFDPFGLIMPLDIYHYLISPGRKDNLLSG